MTEANTVTVKVSKSKAGKVTKATTSRKRKGPKMHGVRGWATFGVLFTLALSALLNGYANAQHSPNALAGWLMGFAVPVLVLVLSKIAGEKWQGNQRAVAKLAGGAGLSLLILSVWHCAESIALLTGSPVWLALPMSVAIDVGLVACEVALITEPRE